MIEVVALLAAAAIAHLLWPYLARRGAAYSTSRKEAAAWAFRQIGVAGKRVYDLGCGYGVVLTLARSMGAVPIGVEIDPLRWAICRLRCRCVVLLRDMFKVDLSDADVVYVFQWPSVNIRLAEKLARELKPSAYVVSYMWEIPGLTLVAKNPRLKIYIYQKNI
ncbi:MAG: class I SAM-dependent methyltransferase [Pyrobaculum sp.]